jgi:hypothetical protein
MIKDTTNERLRSEIKTLRLADYFNVMVSFPDYFRENPDTYV